MGLGGCTNHTFTCANQTVEQVEDFKHLGLHLHQSGHIAHLIEPLPY